MTYKDILIEKTISRMELPLRCGVIAKNGTVVFQYYYENDHNNDWCYSWVFNGDNVGLMKIFGNLNDFQNRPLNVVEEELHIASIAYQFFRVFIGHYNQVVRDFEEM